MMPTEIRERIRSRALGAIAERTFPGAVIGISRDGTREILPFGRFTYEGDTPLVAENTVYDCASITKSVPTAALVLTFVSEGKLHLRDKVTKHIPEFRNDHGSTIEDLLHFRVRGPRMSALRGKSIEEIYAHVVEHGFDGPPAERAYTNLPSYVLGVILERVAGVPLAELSQTYFFTPLRMKSTTYFPNAAECPPTEIQGEEIIQGIVHDESARVFAKAHKAVGHAGLFSAASDLLSFLEGLLSGQFPAIVEGAERGLGWQVAQDWFMGTHTSPKAFGKTGFTGVSVLVDSPKNTALVILSNRCFPTRPEDAASLTSAMNLFRRDIADIVFG